MIERSADLCTWTIVQWPAANYSMSDITVRPGTTYSYRCTFWGGDGQMTLPSPPVAVTTSVTARRRRH